MTDDEKKAIEAKKETGVKELYSAVGIGGRRTGGRGGTVVG